MADDRIGDLLVKHGVLSHEDVAAGVAHARAHGWKIGKALIDLGMVDAKLLNAVIEAQDVSRGITPAARRSASARMLAAARATVQDIHAALDRIERAMSK